MISAIMSEVEASPFMMVFSVSVMEGATSMNHCNVLVLLYALEEKGTELAPVSTVLGWLFVVTDTV